MIRYLKYIFLGFGLLAIGIGTFFFLNNKKDLQIAWDSKNELSYDYLSKNCPENGVKYFYPCFREHLQAYMEKVSLTGISIGLKLAFNFMEEDKQNTSKFANEKVKLLNYSINYLEVNNLAIANSYKRFFGFEFTYPGFVSRLRDYYKGAYEFSENLIHGLRGKDGIVSIEDEEVRMELTKRFEIENSYFNSLRQETDQFVNSEIERLTGEDESRSGK